MKELDFINSIKKVSSSRKHRVTGSYGIYDGYKYYRKNKPKDSKYILTESQYFSITRRINQILAEMLSKGEDITLPSRLGRLEVRKRKVVKIFDGTTLKTNLPIDWDKTLKLWYEDKDSFTNKVLVKSDIKELYRLYYNRSKANYANKSFYQFNFNRELKRKIKDAINNNEIDAYNI